MVLFSGSGNAKTSSGAAVSNCPPMYMDLVYIPNHCSAKNVDAEFFKRVRSSYYVVSGNDQPAQEPNKTVLDALLEGKAQWGNDMQVLFVAAPDIYYFVNTLSARDVCGRPNIIIHTP